MEKRYKVKLNSVEKVEELLQEIYDDSMRQITLIQSKISDLESATTLVDEPLDSRVKYAKAIHDYVTDREKAIGRKLDVSRLMTEVLKQNGDVKKVLADNEVLGKMDDEFKKIRDEVENGGFDNNQTNTKKPETYITNKPSDKWEQK